MLSNRSLPLTLALALAAAVSPQVRAASAGDAGAQVVVPFVAYDKAAQTLVFVENHETRDVDVQLRWVGERTSASPGLRVCGVATLPAGSLSTFDLRQTCRLPGLDERGMLLALVLKRSGLARLSARGRVDLLDSRTGDVLQTLVVDGLPLGSLDTTDGIHVASGLRSDPVGQSGLPVTTDCFFGTFTDGSGAGGALLRFGLRDRDGQPLGSDVYLSQRPFELQRLPDVFKLVGAPAAAYDDVRAVFFPAGGGDAILGYCNSAQELPSKASRSLTSNVAQVAESQDETRRREIGVSSTPEVQGGLTFRLELANRRVVHGLFVQHPDRLSCGLRANDDLVLTAVAPDRSVTAGGTGPGTGWFDAGPRGALASGFSDLWGLEVSWGPNAARTGPVTYTISCLSGNGVSLADELFRN